MPGYCIDACSNRATVEDAISLSVRSSEAALPPPVTVDTAEPTLHYVTNVTLYQKHFTADGEPVPSTYQRISTARPSSKQVADSNCVLSTARG